MDAFGAPSGGLETYRERPAAEAGGARHRGADRRRARSLPWAVFDGLPYRLVVLDRAGHVLMANDAAARLLAEAGYTLKPGVSRCCDLLGCRGGAEPLGDACFARTIGPTTPDLHRLAIAPLDRRGPTLRADTLKVDRRQIVVQLSVHDQTVRGRSAQTVPARAPRLRISMLGPTQLESDAGSVDGSWLDQRAGEVLSFLVCERHRAVPTDELAEAIWPRANQSTVSNVRFAIYELRSRLEPDRHSHGRSAFIVSGKGRYQLDTRHVHVDVDEFDVATEQGLAAFAAGQSAAAAKALDAALALYRGDFLSDMPYAQWTAMERSRLRELAVQALRVRAEIARQAGDLAGLVANFERLRWMEPFDMEIQREWISICVRLGRYGEARQSYVDLVRRTMSEFGQRPPFELLELLELDDQQQLKLI